MKFKCFEFHLNDNNRTMLNLQTKSYSRPIVRKRFQICEGSVITADRRSVALVGDGVCGVLHERPIATHYITHCTNML